MLLICNGRLRERLLFAWKIWAWKMGAPKIGLGKESSAAQTASLFYQRMLRQLERAGCRKSPCQTPLEFAASLPAREFAAPASQLTNLCMAARFGGQEIEFSRLADVLDQLKLSLRRRSRRAK